MSEQAPAIDEKVHRRLAAELFNKTWEYIEKAHRTPDEDAEMIHGAHASRYHWGVVGKPLNHERGEWQIARVYTLVGRAEPALYHARRCLEICEREGIGDFDVAFAHEAMARASALAGDSHAFRAHYEKAKSLAPRIAESGDREYFLKDLDGGPWFGMR